MSDAKVQIPIVIRQATEADAHFVLNAWLKSFAAHRSLLLAPALQSDHYFTCHHEVIIRLLQDSTVVVAANPEDSDQIYGWCCYANEEDCDVLHYVYCKHDLRHFGVASRLIAAGRRSNSLVVSHITDAGRALLHAMQLAYTVDPYKAFGI